MKRNKRDVGDDKMLDREGEVYGYVRESTDLQDIGKQKDMIDSWCKRSGFRDYGIVEGGEISSSKSKTARNLDFLNTLENGDTLVCSEISRLSRSTLEILEIVNDMLRRGVRIVFIQHNLDFKDLSNPITKIILHMFSVFAEVERDRISQRTKEALRVLKERGVRLGF